MINHLKSKELKELNINDIVDHNLYRCNFKYKGKNKHYIPNLLLKSDKGDIIAVKSDFKLSWHWGVELKRAIIGGNIINYKEVIQYEGKVIFKEFSEFFYNERLKCKKSNPAKANFYKLVMNSLYGKFG